MDRKKGPDESLGVEEIDVAAKTSRLGYITAYYFV